MKSILSLCIFLILLSCLGCGGSDIGLNDDENDQDQPSTDDQASNTLRTAPAGGTKLEPLLPRSPMPSISGYLHASRQNGIAPMGVFFDVGERPWSEIEETAYTWFLDGTINARGYLTAMTFDKPGNYQVTLEVHRKGQAVGQETVTIQVNEFTGSTCYVSSSDGNDNNDGHAPETALNTFAKARSSCVAANSRILFKRGDIFPIASGEGMQINLPGNFIIDSYGDPSKANPLFQFNSTAQWESVIYIDTPNDEQISLNNFDIVGKQSPTESSYYGINIHRGRNILLSNLKLSSLLTAITADSGPIKQIFHTIVKDVEIDHCVQYGGYYANTVRTALLGVHIHKTQLYHGSRVQGGDYFLVMGAEFAENIGFTDLPIRGEFNYGLVQDSSFTNLVSATPQNDASAEHESKIIYERNKFGHSNLGGWSALNLQSNDIVVRNNLFINSQINMGEHPMIGNADRVKIYHNSFFGHNNWGIYMDRPTNVTIRNNVANITVDTALDYLAAYRLLSIGSFSGYDFADNSWYFPDNKQDNSFVYDANAYTLAGWQQLTNLESGTDELDPKFVDPLNGDFNLQSDSPAKDKASTISQSFEDYTGRGRPVANHDRGAVELL